MATIKNVQYIVQAARAIRLSDLVGISLIA